MDEPAPGVPLEMKAVEAVFVSAALILQQSHDTLVQRLPASPEARLGIAAELARLGHDIAVLGQAGEVLVRRRGLLGG